MYDLDHFWEVNIGRDIYDHVSRDVKSGAANTLKTRIKDSFNQSFNLGFTEGSVNNAKCAAVVEFSNDLKFREAHDEGLPHYLRQRFTQKAVTRGDVARISTRIVTAYDDLREHLVKEYDSEWDLMFVPYSYEPEIIENLLWHGQNIIVRKPLSLRNSIVSRLEEFING
jgi:hypothetical protein